MNTEKEPVLDTHTWLLALLAYCEEMKFYGQLTIKLEAGKIALVKREETLKPPVC